MKQYYIRAYQLMSELAVINQMSDSVAKATRWYAWNLKAIEWAELANPSCSHSHLQLVQLTSHLPQQNHAAVNQRASKI
ncbi:MAG: hypothetical protein ACI86X_000688 [Moritella sp.]|jgi:hypothetical protein